MAGNQDGFLSDIDLSALAQLWSMLNLETRLQQEMGQDAPNVRGGVGILEHAATGPVAGLKGLKSLKSLKKKWADDYGYPAPRIIREGKQPNYASGSKVDDYLDDLFKDHPDPKVSSKPQKQKKVLPLKSTYPFWDSKLERWVFRKGK